MDDDLRVEAAGDPARRFPISSVAKTFVATVALQLVAEGRVQLDDAVEEYLPGLVPGGEAITIRQLLNHTSGVPDFFPALLAEGLDGERTPHELVALALRSRPGPRERWAYSNTNYVVAGLVLEAGAGASFDDELASRIVEPLGLAATRVDVGSPAWPALTFQRGRRLAACVVSSAASCSRPRNSTRCSTSSRATGSNRTATASASKPSRR